MAACCGGRPEPSFDEQKIDKIVEKKSKSKRVEESGIIKMLLLGAAESGKSTIFKQMKVLQQDGYKQSEKLEFIPIIRSNVINGMKVILTQVIAWNECDASDAARYSECRDTLNELIHARLADVVLSAKNAKMIKELWAEETVQAAYVRRSEFQLSDSCKYFFEKVEAISQPEYLPTVDDILQARVRTTGIVQMDFKINNARFQMFDVGGQRNERRKWIHAFDDVTALVFVAALSEYDQVLAEDGETNRMKEAVNLFGQIVNSSWFKNTNCILFLNKRDLFQEKLKNKSLVRYYPDYNGEDGDYEESSDFFKKKFHKKNKNKNKQVYIHCTCATDTDNVAFVMDSVVSMLMDKNMAASGMG